MSAASDRYTVAMNFSWLEEGSLAGCRGPRSDQDLQFLASKGIKALVRLAYAGETGVTSQNLERKGMKDCYEPVRDFTAPSQNQIDRVVAFIRNALDGGYPVAVSCGAGYGRTGTILACYLICAGLSADDAIEKLISIRPCSKEILTVPGQKQAIVEFEQRFRSGNHKPIS